IRINGGQTLIDGRLATPSVHLDSGGGVITGIDSDAAAGQHPHASGPFVFPRVGGIPRAAFGRQMMPRPGVGFPLDIALCESDRQAVANGITTVFHGVTWSWEPGLRGPENARAILAALESLRLQLGADTRFHLRHETYNLDAE